MVNETELKGTTMTVQQTFDAAYWAAQRPEVVALLTVADQTTRDNQAAALAMQGFIIDVPIMVWGWDPYLVMQMRQQFGYTWVPSALQPSVAEAPGVNQAGTVSYNPLAPPPGSVKVSLNLADYPPFAPVAAATTAVQTADPVGQQSLGNIYLSVKGDTSPDGTKYTDSRGTFLKHLVATPFGANAYWQLLSA